MYVYLQNEKNVVFLGKNIGAFLSLSQATSSINTITIDDWNDGKEFANEIICKSFFLFFDRSHS